MIQNIRKKTKKKKKDETKTVKNKEKIDRWDGEGESFNRNHLASRLVSYVQENPLRRRRRRRRRLLVSRRLNSRLGVSNLAWYIESKNKKGKRSLKHG